MKREADWELEHISKLLHRSCLLQKQGNTAMIIAILAYGVLSYSMSTMLDLGEFASCQRVSNLPPWLRILPFGSAFTFLSSALLQAMFGSKTLMVGVVQERPLQAVHHGAMVVLILAGASHLHTFLDPELLCLDGFGQWVEWFVTVPLLAYLGCAVISKDALSFLDWVMLANAASMILTGFLMTVDPDRKWLYFLLSCTNFLIFPAIVTAMDEADKTSVRSVSFDGTMSIDDANLYIVSLQRRWRRQIFDRFFLVCGFFPAVFGLQACGVISRDVGIASFLVGSLLGKLVFSSVFAQSYLALSLEMSTVSHSIVRSHETRRSFLRYVFHELRVPLHTLTMGMPLLLDLVGPRESLSAENAQLIDMMHASTASLVDNMSQVLTLHRLREGEILRQPTVLRLDQFLMDELHRAQEQMQALKGLSLSCASSLSSLASSASASASASVTQDGTESALYVEGSAEYLRILVQGVLGALGGCVKSGAAMRVEMMLQPPLSSNIIPVRVRGNTKPAENNETSEACNDGASIGNAIGDCHRVRNSFVKLVGRGILTCAQHITGGPPPQVAHAHGQQTIYLCFTSSSFGVTVTRLREMLEAHEDALRTADLQHQNGIGLGFVLAMEVIDKLPMGSLALLHSGSKQSGQQLEGILVQFTLPVAHPNGGNDTSMPALDKQSSLAEQVHEVVDIADVVLAMAPVKRATVTCEASSSPSLAIKHPGEAAASPSSSDPSLPVSSPVSSPSTPMQRSTLPSIEHVPVPPPVADSPSRRPPRPPSTPNGHIPTISPEATASPGKHFTPIGGRRFGVSAEVSVTLPPSQPSSIPSSAQSSRSASPLQPLVPNGTPSPGVTSSRPQWNILVVDDAPSNSKMLCHALSRRGHVCVVAENGLEAVLLMREDIHRFDMVFMDHTMPVMTGIDATHVLREELHYEGYVIGVTGNVLPDDMSRFVASGANIVLLKPLRTPDLDLVLSYIAGHGLQCDLTRRLRIDSVHHVVTAEPYVNQDEE